MDDPFKPVTPTVAPGLTIEKVPNGEVIEVFNRILHALLTAHQEKTGGDPVDTIAVVLTKTGKWITRTSTSKRFLKFQAPTINETYLKTFEVMGVEVAQDLGIMEEYEREYSQLERGET